MSTSGDPADAVKRFGIGRRDLRGDRETEPVGRAIAARPDSAWERLGSTQYTRGDLDAAVQSYDRYSAIARRMSAAEPGNARRRGRSPARTRRWARSWHSAAGGTKPSIGCAARLTMYESLAAIDPSNASLRRAVSVTYTNLGDVLAETGRPTEALMHYRQSVRALERLAREDPDNRQSQRDLASHGLPGQRVEGVKTRVKRASVGTALGLLRSWRTIRRRPRSITASMRGCL